MKPPPLGEVPQRGGEGYTITLDAGEGSFDDAWDEEGNQWTDYNRYMTFTIRPGDAIGYYNWWEPSAVPGKMFRCWEDEDGEVSYSTTLFAGDAEIIETVYPASEQYARETITLVTDGNGGEPNAGAGAIELEKLAF